MNKDLDFTTDLEVKRTAVPRRPNNKRLMMRAYGQEPCERCGEILSHAMHGVVSKPEADKEYCVALF